MRRTDVIERVSDDRYAGLRGRVLLHAGDNSQAAAFGKYADGVVLHGSRGYPTGSELNPGSTVLIDPERYADDRVRRTQPELFPETLEECAENQVRAGATCLLAPSRFPVDRSTGSLLAELSVGSEFMAAAQDVAPTMACFAPIVVRYDELADRRWIPLLRDSDLPIATVFAGYADPLGAPKQLEGAIDLVQQAGLAMVLRCDLSIAGLMALGAISGAIGASSAVRHLWLPSKRANAPASPALFVPRAANWMKTVFVRQALADPDLDDIFACGCNVCGPQGDVRYLVVDDSNPDLKDRHSIASAVMLARDVVEARRPLDAWRDVCRRASQTYSTLEQLGISGPTMPPAMDAWREVLG